MTPSHSKIHHLIKTIAPHDDVERGHIADTLAWIESGAPLFRIQKPDVPHQHLVSYFVLFDARARKILLVDHKKALLWLPAGGHVELDEDPKDTVRRECREELGIDAEFWAPAPVFLTSTLTVGLTAGHRDVSLWYVLKGDSKATYEFDRDEFHAVRWFDFDAVHTLSSDPHLGRFLEKLSTLEPELR